MNQYRCETCTHFEHRPGRGGWYCKHPLLKERDKYAVNENCLTAWEFYHIKEYGCASHSDFQNEREKIICCARCPCKEPDCEDFCKHFQPQDNLISIIKGGNLIKSREALEHHFGRHNTCKSERTDCPLCMEELRQAGETK